MIEYRRVDKTKYLGIVIDQKLHFQPQIELIEDKLSRLLGISYRLKNHFNRNSALKFFYSCVYSTINYCISVYGGVSLCTRRCDRIDRLYSKIVKNLFSKYCRDESQDIFKNEKLLRFRDVYRLRISLYMYKIVRINSIPSLESIIDLTYPSHSYSTRTRNILNLPFPRV